MRKLKLQVQMTIDGFIAGPNDEHDWMIFSTDEKSANRINELIDSTDTILLGRKMTDEFVDYWTSVLENPDSPEYSFARKMVNIPKVVFSKTVTESRWANTTVANGDITEEVEKLKNQDGKDIIVYGGASFVSALIKNDLIDEYNLFVNPVALGKGMSVFGEISGNMKLKLVAAKPFECGINLLQYERQSN